MDDRDLQRLNDILTVAGSILTIGLAMRLLLGPDAITRVKMQALRTVSRSAKRGADSLTTLSLACDTQYHRLTNVTI